MPFSIMDSKSYSVSRSRAFFLTSFIVLAFLSSPVSSISFEECGKLVQKLVDEGNDTIKPYIYKQRPDGLKPGHSPPLLITTPGCKKFCGADPKYYAWSTISDTITTWVLPLAGGLILQAPFESTQWMSTILVLSRWLGNPVSVLTCILWNIRTTRKCAQLCDMAVPRDVLPGYVKRPLFHQLKAEYRRMLEESVLGTHQKSGQIWPDLKGLDEDERNTACAFAELRDSLYILCVFNQYAFDHSNRDEVKLLLSKALFSRDPWLIERRKKIAANLRSARKHGVVQVLISLLWFLVALVISIYKAFGSLGDESTALNLAIGLLGGWLPAIIASSLVDQNPSNTSVARDKLQKFLDQVSALDEEKSVKATLLGFCGQARRRWHYGCAYPILMDFQLHLGARDRGLIRYYQDETVYNAALHETQGNPLWSFNPVEFWQILAAWFLVGSSAVGAVVISFHTPTVGLGCRSGGYMVYGIIAFVAFVFEFGGWIADKPTLMTPSKRRRWFFYVLSAFLVVLEVANCAWLVYIILAQTWGIYNTCECRSSNWATGGGYSDFAGVETYQNDYVVLPYWIAGTVLGLLPTIAIFTIVYQWCTQSFLATENYDNAMRGLRRVRAWKTIFHLDFLHSIFIFGPDRIRSIKLGRRFRSVTWTR